MIDRSDSQRGANHIASIDVLRGVAAWMVVFSHFFGFPPIWGQVGGGSFATVMQTAGGLGVEIFFVISGFILPYSLYRGRYVLANFWQFVWKRMVRLEPPYIASLILVIAILLFLPDVPGLAGKKDLQAVQILLHFGYLAGFPPYRWLNGVYWTLSCEFQFYVMIGLTFPKLLRASPWQVIATLIAISLIGPLLSQAQRATGFLPHWLPIFSIGILAFLWRIERLTARQFAFAVITIAAIGVWLDGVFETLAALGTMTVILAWRGPVSRPGRILAKAAGAISYSLYLVHFPLGIRVLVAVAAISSPFIGAVAACAASVVVALIFYFGIERPAQRYASRITYRRSADELSVPPIIETPRLQEL